MGEGLELSILLMIIIEKPYLTKHIILFLQQGWCKKYKNYCYTEQKKPKRIRTDNGPEFIAKVFKDFCSDHGIEIQYIQPGKPAQNAYIERFNRTFREDVLDAYLFESISHVNALAYEWQIDYNSNHPHKALNGLSPWLYAEEQLVS